VDTPLIHGPNEEILVHHQFSYIANTS